MTQQQLHQRRVQFLPNFCIGQENLTYVIRSTHNQSYEFLLRNIIALKASQLPEFRGAELGIYLGYARRSAKFLNQLYT